ncbi:hypothetical protein [Methanocaldococcus sp.]|uniref:hypothetical protein n=1 Tax=Methanocaldococcus sp. TaxID=2152917 RepID=UPI00262E43C8|nr:hypothetical protein [Methanocaldococcus sp.]MCQ6253841.1 hypothetical protein [Methanocaldococcus sp.]
MFKLFNNKPEENSLNKKEEYKKLDEWLIQKYNLLIQSIENNKKEGRKTQGVSFPKSKYEFLKALCSQISGRLSTLPILKSH